MSSSVYLLPNMLYIDDDSVAIHINYFDKPDFVDFIKKVNQIKIDSEPDRHEPVSEWAKTHFKVGSSGAYGIERMWQGYEPLYCLSRSRFTFGQFVAYKEFLNQIDLNAAPIVGETIWHGFYEKVERVDEKFINEWSKSQ